MAVDIKLTDLTNGSVVSGEWSGTGVLDVLVQTLNSNIDIQYKKGRIKGTDYANVYLGSMQSIISESIRFLLEEKITESQVELSNEKIDSEKINQDATIAKVRDEHGKIIDGSGTINVDLATTNAHFHEQEIREQEALKRAQDVKIATAVADNTVTDGYAKIAIILRDYGYTVSYDVNGNPTFTPLDSVADVENTSGTIPVSKHEASMVKARTEANIAINTGKSYLADSFYKQTKILQELIFSLGNSGIIGNGNDGSVPATNSIYGKITEAMEKAMNGMSAVYGVNISTDNIQEFIDIDADAGAQKPSAS